MDDDEDEAVAATTSSGDGDGGGLGGGYGATRVCVARHGIFSMLPFWHVLVCMCVCCVCWDSPLY